MFPIVKLQQNNEQRCCLGSSDKRKDWSSDQGLGLLQHLHKVSVRV